MAKTSKFWPVKPELYTPPRLPPGIHQDSSRKTWGSVKTSVKLAIEKGLAKLNKWYKAIDETDVYFICLALDPHFKLAYVKHNWDSQYYDIKLWKKWYVFDQYKEAGGPSTKRTPATSSSASNLPVPKKGYASSWMRASINLRLQDDQALQLNVHQELLDYLKSPLESEACEPVCWWGYHAVHRDWQGSTLGFEGFLILSDKFTNCNLRTYANALYNGSKFKGLQGYTPGFAHGLKPELYTPPRLPPGIRPDCPESWRNPPGIQEFLVNEKIPHGFRVDSGWIPGIPI
ncbi:hypothetical protein BYT27DRAFT_7214452 [Phlegmacium glaucopus]|nr:hypothetical protein BYT27DRAFT_7214452 [Phlegmacium glaucopus]